MINKVYSEDSLINYFKCLAIVMVVLTHYKFDITTRLIPIFPYLIVMAVPIFMIITGINYSKSYLFNEIKSLKQMYNYKSIMKRILRITMPFLVIYLLEILFQIGNKNYFKHFFTYLINGGIGPGSYYTPVMIQIIMLFPILYLLIKKYNTKGLFIILAINLLYETLSYIFGLSDNTYRIISLRYLTYVGAGIWMTLNKPKIRTNYLILSIICGCLYLYIITYTNFEILPFTKWQQTAMPSILYIFPIFYLCCKNFKDKLLPNVLNKTLVTIGKASWHIFLVQMMFYAGPEKSLKIFPPIIHLGLNLAICLSLGIMFYYLEFFIRKKLNNKSS